MIRGSHLSITAILVRHGKLDVRLICLLVIVSVIAIVAAAVFLPSGSRSQDAIESMYARQFSDVLFGHYMSGTIVYDTATINTWLAADDRFSPRVLRIDSGRMADQGVAKLWLIATDSNAHQLVAQLQSSGRVLLYSRDGFEGEVSALPAACYGEGLVASWSLSIEQ